MNSQMKKEYVAGTVMICIATLIGFSVIGDLIALNMLGELTRQYVENHKEFLWFAFFVAGVLFTSGGVLVARSKDAV